MAFFFGINVSSKSPRQSQKPLRPIVTALLPAKFYELQKRKAISIFRTDKRLSANVRAWRCGGIPCYVSPDMFLSKDMKDENLF